MFLKEISDDLLICLRREGNQDAIDMLFDRYQKFIYGIINDTFRCFNHYVDYEEMYQEAMCVFIACLEKYDVDNGCFYFFVRTSIERKLKDITKRNEKYNKIISLDENFYENSKECLIDYVCENDEKSFIYDLLKENCSVECMEIVDLKMKGYTYEEISLLLGISKQAIYRRIVKIKNMLKDITKN